MKSDLLNTLKLIVKPYGITLYETDPALAFKEAIRSLYEATGVGVVVLIDEYDRPILEHIENSREAEIFRDTLETFYQIIKGSESLLRFVFIAGVTKFAKVSVFSKLNNLTDISKVAKYACMFGYTQEELEGNFNEYIKKALAKGIPDHPEINSRTLLLEEIKHWYDGFRFVPGEATVYNPVSIGKFFWNDQEFANYWFETGTPTFLMKLLKQKGLTLVDAARATMSEASLSTFDVNELSTNDVQDERLIQILFQTGYLTIEKLKRVRPERVYQLRFPNYEVSYSFEKNLLNVYAGDMMLE